MNVTIRRIGNSEGIIISKEVLDRLGLKTGDSLEMQVENGGITLKPTDEDLSRQLEAARYFMDKYKVALKKLAE
ncbi:MULTISPECIES: AbrB/MazE/SpoVT family DNA-binding domain-containing protein [unclassified Rhizobium]|jgi:putative addiction module antidote|uniref:AbrB/MazE/SpoVT family DNA-binding domain-containing protein n=1 Tax=unclassified Rhizobium TaxID=2613769 RepID=UPI001A9921E0|nr:MULTISPECIES: AbrB/MazE/SpoVT family DNA-binding domain-containing protein [unclassified Rhizobium]MBX5157420.1 AbrB/MazE/SpoVT family DNA-binding domain-containing protein [Rhizobium sp. NZLR8]MBX5163152.1 AbrB/MazE/SpoVT family DNA-binding domain-containing protein [Rhizobium sp. NZLR4b]MBX5183929.1 AbrB/MazE/SpoVT family DNA-binding domain-containing protein [Rhizobium sp. NZLR5]MBX5188802.1 AbrB/MazE/SpoVT family DNA-binding domain-containing protein [Rhizobium sp. NZLR3b]MBX5195567.1 A